MNNETAKLIFINAIGDYLENLPPKEKRRLNRRRRKNKSKLKKILEK